MPNSRASLRDIARRTWPSDQRATPSSETVTSGPRSQLLALCLVERLQTSTRNYAFTLPPPVVPEWRKPPHISPSRRRGPKRSAGSEKKWSIRDSPDVEGGAGGTGRADRQGCECLKHGELCRLAALLPPTSLLEQTGWPGCLRFRPTCHAGSLCRVTSGSTGSGDSGRAILG